MKRVTYWNDEYGCWAYHCSSGDAAKILAAYENTQMDPAEYKKHADALKKLDIEHMHDLLLAERDGKLVVLPCGKDTVFTIEKDFLNCDQCNYKLSKGYQPSDGEILCNFEEQENYPNCIKGHEVEGFEITFGEKGDPIVSLPGEYGYEGLTTFRGIDEKCYYTHEEAAAALKKMEEYDND